MVTQQNAADLKQQVEETSNHLADARRLAAEAEHERIELQRQLQEQHADHLAAAQTHQIETQQLRAALEAERANAVRNLCHLSMF